MVQSLALPRLSHAMNAVRFNRLLIDRLIRNPGRGLQYHERPLLFLPSLSPTPPPCFSRIPPTLMPAMLKLAQPTSRARPLAHQIDFVDEYPLLPQGFLGLRELHAAIPARPPHHPPGYSNTHRFHGAQHRRSTTITTTAT